MRKFVPVPGGAPAKWSEWRAGALADGEKSVSELTDALNLRQAAVSEHLARLRQEELVAARREAQSVYYSIADETADKVVQVLYKRYCGV